MAKGQSDVLERAMDTWNVLTLRMLFISLQPQVNDLICSRALFCSCVNGDTTYTEDVY